MILLLHLQTFLLSSGINAKRTKCEKITRKELLHMLMQPNCRPPSPTKYSHAGCLASHGQGMLLLPIQILSLSWQSLKCPFCQSMQRGQAVIALPCVLHKSCMAAAVDGSDLMWVCHAHSNQISGFQQH